MSDPDANSRDTLPIERGFPIEQVNDLADREGRAKMYYRPLSTMHKWWARRLGSVFRAISLYSLVDDPSAVEIHSADQENLNLSDFGDGDTEDTTTEDLAQLIESVSLTEPDALWELYPKDVRVDGKTVLDPFMGGGTSLMEAIRFGAAVTGVDLNPVAWFISKKSLEAHEVDADELQQAFDDVRATVADELQSHYETTCPHDENHVADVVYALWVRKLDCTSCGETVPLFKDYRVANGRYEDDDKYNVYCPDCESVFLTDDYQTESVCTECGYEYIPANGPVSRGGNYGCPSCGLQYPIVDAIADGQSYAEDLYAIEYYCTECEDEGKDRATFKGFTAATDKDRTQFDRASEAWHSAEELDAYIPQSEIPEGAITAASGINGNDVFRHGYETWSDMFNDRQLYCLSTLLAAIDDVDNQTVKEYLLLAFSDSLMFQNNFALYNISGTKIEGIFRQNSYQPQVEYAENNVWGTRAGRGTFKNTWEKIVNAVEFAHQPTERYLEDGELKQTDSFENPVGGEYTLHQGDVRDVELESEFDAIITDPPYYDNVVYSEVSDFFYVWQRLLLSDEYACFTPETTPREESIVSNPAIDKDGATFERELKQSFSRMRDVLKDDGVLTFTYRHSGIESWGALLESLCDEGFDVTATYPISANLSEFVMGDELSFSVIVVARPMTDRDPISWAALRRQMYRTAQRAEEEIQEGQTISEGDISVVKLGRCFREYSKHHGKVHREGSVMSATDVVAGMYDIIAGGDGVSTDEIYLSLLSMEEPTFNDVNRLCRGTGVSPNDLQERAFFDTTDGFTLLRWHDEQRMAYLQAKAPDELSALERVQLLQYAADEETKPREESRELEVTGDMIDVASELADITGDETFRQILRD
jgi:adenine-specific DNA methylase